MQQSAVFYAIIEPANFTNWHLLPPPHPIELLTFSQAVLQNQLCDENLWEKMPENIQFIVRKNRRSRKWGSCNSSGRPTDSERQNPIGHQ